MGTHMDTHRGGGRERKKKGRVERERALASVHPDV